MLLSTIVLLGLLLILSAFASSSETAFFSLDRFQLRRLKERYVRAYERIKPLLDHPTRLLIVILLVNETANLSIANLVTQTVERYNDPVLRLFFGGQPIKEETRWFTVTMMSMLVAAPITMTFGEITPKVLASRLNQLIAALNSKILIVLYKILYPALVVLDFVITSTLKKLGSDQKAHLSKFLDPLDEEDFVALLDEAHKEGTVEPSEKKLIQKVFSLDDTTCSQAMVPIQKAFVLNEQAKISDVMSDIQVQKYSRIPVFSKNRKHIVGVLYVKDLLDLRLSKSSKKKSDPTVGDLMAKPSYVSPGVNLSSLLRRFRKSKVHLAIVADKNQQALGVISLEDVLENIFGEIEDERDVEA